MLDRWGGFAAPLDIKQEYGLSHWFAGRTPLLYIVAKNDTVNTTDLALKAYKKAREPKQLVMIEGDHFAPYIEEFSVCAESACHWFNKNLLKTLEKSEKIDSEFESIRKVK